jgi:ornithine carbamoyltransferase
VSGFVVDKTLIGRDYIATIDWTVEELEVVLRTSWNLKDAFRRGVPTEVLRDRTLFMLFFDNSTRTRNAFEAGMTQLGGHAHFLDVATTQIAHGESAKDTGVILSSYGHGIAVRHDVEPGIGHAYMTEISHWAERPVINLQSDVDHPTQTIADLMTLREVFGHDLRGLRVAVSWAYAPSYAKPLSVPQGLITLLPRFGIDVVLAHPPEFPLISEQLSLAGKLAKENGTRFEITNDMTQAFENANAVYPKSWGCLDLFENKSESLKLAEEYVDWICDEKALAVADPRSVYMHCLPADRGYEVSDPVIDGERSVVYAQADNRLHTAKALCALTMQSER